MGLGIPEVYGSDLDDVVYGRADIRTARKQGFDDVTVVLREQLS